MLNLTKKKFLFFFSFLKNTDYGIEAGNIVHIFSSCWKFTRSFNSVTTFKCRKNIGQWKWHSTTVGTGRCSKRSKWKGNVFFFLLYKIIIHREISTSVWSVLIIASSRYLFNQNISLIFIHSSVSIVHIFPKVFFLFI